MRESKFLINTYLVCPVPRLYRKNTQQQKLPRLPRFKCARPQVCSLPAGRSKPRQAGATAAGINSLYLNTASQGGSEKCPQVGEQNRLPQLHVYFYALPNDKLQLQRFVFVTTAWQTPVKQTRCSGR